MIILEFGCECFKNETSDVKVFPSVYYELTFSRKTMAHVVCDMANV